MLKIITRRILLLVLQLLILSIILFVFAKLMLGDSFTGLITFNRDARTIAVLSEQAGLNDPWYVQYMHWIGNALKGDFGQSYTYEIPISTLIGQRLGNTLWLSTIALLFTYLLAIPLGLYAGRHNGSFGDKVIGFYNYVGYAIPTFVFALLLIWIFGYTIQIFPTRGTSMMGLEAGNLTYIWDRFYHMILPSLAYALVAATNVIQYLRARIFDAKQEDYVRTARSKGVPEKKVYSKHIFRNASLSTVSFIGYDVTGLIGASVFIESIFDYPGLGQLFISSLSVRDYSVVTALLLLFGVAALFGTLLSDIIMSIVDPRIRIE